MSECPRCGNNKIVKSGKHYNQKNVVVQRFQCKLCGTSFCNSGYFRGKHPLALVQYAGLLYGQGLSYEKVATKIEKQFKQKVSRTTIWDWMRMLHVQSRPKSSGDQKNKIVRNLIEVGIITTVRFASSEVSEKFLLLNNVVVKETEARDTKLHYGAN